MICCSSVEADPAAAGVAADGRGIGRARRSDCASRTASSKRPIRPRLRKPVTATLPGCPHSSWRCSSSATHWNCLKRGSSSVLLGTIDRSNTPARRVQRTLVPLGGRAIGVAPGVGGIVERAGVDECPVHEVAARIMRVFVGVEDIGDAELADRDDEAVCGLRAGELVDVGVDFLRFRRRGQSSAARTPAAAARREPTAPTL